MILPLGVGWTTSNPEHVILSAILLRGKELGRLSENPPKPTENCRENAESRGKLVGSELVKN